MEENHGRFLPLSLKKHFGTLRDPRLRRRRLHELLDIKLLHRHLRCVIGNADMPAGYP